MLYMVDAKFAVHLVYLAKAVDFVHKIGVSAEVILFYYLLKPDPKTKKTGTDSDPELRYLLTI